MKIRRSSYYFLYLFFSLSVFFTGEFQCGGQSSENDSENALLPASDSAVSKHAVYTSIGYGNDMLCLGSSISGDKPYYFGSVSYGFNNEFFASATTYHLAAFDPFLSFHTFSLNYSHIFSSWFDISASAFRYQTNEVLTDTLFNSFFYGDLTIGVDWRIIYTKLSVSRIFSDLSTNYFQIRNSRYFQTPEFFKGKANISFDPYATLLFGNLTTITTTEGTTISVSPPYGSGGSGRNSTGSGTTSSSTSTTTGFGIMELDLGLPVAINTDYFTIEAEPGYIFPLYKGAELPGEHGFVFYLSCYFKIF